MSFISETNEFLDFELFARLPNLEMRAKYLTTGFFSGLHRSPLHGGMAEFKEYRSYQLGDDPRFIDWKLFSRSDRLNIKLKEDETNMNVYLLSDISSSLSYKSSFSKLTKWEFSRSLTAAFIYFLYRQKDAVSLLLLGDKKAEPFRPSLKQSNLARMMSHLKRQANQNNPTCLEDISRYIPLVKPRSILLLFSDFYIDVARLKKLLQPLVALKCEVILFQIMDPSECHFEFDEASFFVDAESKEKVLIQPELVKKEYLRKINRHFDALNDMIQGLGGSYIRLMTNEVPLQAFGHYLATRMSKV